MAVARLTTSSGALVFGTTGAVRSTVTSWGVPAPTQPGSAARPREKEMSATSAVPFVRMPVP
jgi:hypothetical protein